MIFTSPILLTMQPDCPPLEQGAVVVRKGIVQAVGPRELLIKKYRHDRVLNLQNAVLMPGLVNLHTHLELPILLDSLRARSFPGWVMNLIRAKRRLDEGDYESAAKKNIETLIQTGTTTVGEICTHKVSPQYLRKSGLRAVVFQEIISMRPDQDHHGISFPPRPFRASSLVRFGLSPHAPYTVSEIALRRIADLSQRMNLLLCMHIAESKDELRLLQGRSSGFQDLYQLAGWNRSWAPAGSSSVEYLRRIRFLSPHLLAVHAIHVTDKDISALAKSKVSIAHCPRSNRETRAGRMPLKKFLDAGITVGLGTDSLASSPSLNIWDEMRYAYSIHRRDGISAQDILRIATIGGARALGNARETGSLEPGKRADIIAVPLPQKKTGDLYSNLLRETKSCIMSVVNGKILKQQESGFKVHQAAAPPHGL